MSTKRSRRILATSAAMVAALALGACGNGDGDESADGATTGGGDSGEVTTIGFVAVGPEGAWRQANEQNIQDTFTEDAGRSEERRVGKECRSRWAGDDTRNKRGGEESEWERRKTQGKKEERGGSAA